MISTKYIVRRRGDTTRLRVCVAGAVSVPDITGATFKFTVNSLPYPNGAQTQIFQVLGDIIDGPGGVVEFPIDGGNEDHVGFYYFDIEMTDPAGTVSTILFGWYHVKQDITKESSTLAIDSTTHGTEATGP